MKSISNTVGLGEIVRCTVRLCFARGSLIVTRVSASEVIAAPGASPHRAFVLCQLTPIQHRARDDKQRAVPPRIGITAHSLSLSLHLLPSPVPARSLAPADVPHLVFSHLCRHPTHARQLPTPPRRLPTPQHTTGPLPATALLGAIDIHANRIGSYPPSEAARHVHVH